MLGLNTELLPLWHWQSDALTTWLICYTSSTINLNGDGWLQVGSAPACYGSSLGSNPDISQKYKMGDINKRSGHHTLARQKIKNKMYCQLQQHTHVYSTMQCKCGKRYNGTYDLRCRWFVVDWHLTQVYRQSRLTNEQLTSRSFDTEGQFKVANALANFRISSKWCWWDYEGFVGSLFIKKTLLSKSFWHCPFRCIFTITKYFCTHVTYVSYS
jgi:hypothetical protein